MKSKNFLKVLFIGLSVCIVCLPTYLVLFGKKQKAALYLETLVQKTPSCTVLPARFFSDYLNLKPSGKRIIISKLDENKIENRLKLHPIFQDINAKLTNFGELEVSYELKTPNYLVQDFENLTIDNEGYIFPLRPFFSPKRLAKVFIGIEELQFAKPYNLNLAHQVSRYIEPYLTNDFNLEMIDLSLSTDAFGPTREIVTTFSYKNKNHYIRLHPLRIEQGLNRYLHLFHEKQMKLKLLQDLVFDARIKKFATLKNVEPISIEKKSANN